MLPHQPPGEGIRLYYWNINVTVFPALLKAFHVLHQIQVNVVKITAFIGVTVQRVIYWNLKRGYRQLTSFIIHESLDTCEFCFDPFSCSLYMYASVRYHALVQRVLSPSAPEAPEGDSTLWRRRKL